MLELLGLEVEVKSGTCSRSVLNIFLLDKIKLSEMSIDVGLLIAPS